jgi:ferritin-like metal-binding protein YciE
MELQTLRDLFVHELKDLYSAEKQILKALPKMIQKATEEELKDALEGHRRVTEEQVDRLETIFSSLDESTSFRQKCKGMEGLLEEGADLLKEDAPEVILDAGIIGAAQRVEHYEIAAYGTALAYAKLLGEEKAVRLLQQTLAEEKEADEKLTEIAESSINFEAAGEESEEEPGRAMGGVTQRKRSGSGR